MPALFFQGLVWLRFSSGFSLAHVELNEGNAFWLRVQFRV